MTHRGFTLVELLLAAALTLIVFAVALAIVVPARVSFDRDGAGADLAQRLRTGLHTLEHDVRGAGAGAAIAEDIRLPDSVPVIAPLESLDEGASTGVFQALRLITVPMMAAQGRLRVATMSPMGPLKLGPWPRCSAGPVCGFQAGDHAIVFDESGTYDLIEIEQVDLVDASVTPSAPMEGRYTANAVVAVVEVVTYGVMPDGAGGERLVKITGAGATMPVVDHLVDFGIDAFIAAAPADLRGDGTPQYGPRPPLLGEDDDRDAWGAGENCVIGFDTDGNRVPRLARLGPAGQLVKLTPAMLSDGPWCAGNGGRFDFDADLLRIRRVDLRLRVEVPSAGLRGPAGYLFRRAGHSRQPGGWVPDGEFRLSIVPRNLQP